MAIKTSNQITFTEQKKIVEIKEWYLATDQSAGITQETAGWSEAVQAMNETNKYLWNYEEVIYSIGSSEKSDPVIIGFYGKGSDGNGISDIKNYYLTTQTPELPESPEWSETVLMLTPTDKYLWNYDEIIYTDNSSKESEPAIIGVYGDSGADAVDFQIYSVDGFEFNDYLTSIELKTAAFQNGQEINSDISYRWMWWNNDSSASDKYEEIEGATSSSLIVNLGDPYAFTSIKCEMVYDDIVYEDYVSLTKQTVVHTAIVNFFNGSNIITASDDYLIACVELYKDNMLVKPFFEDGVVGGVYISDNNAVLDNVINTDIADEHKTDGNLMYFVCKNVYEDSVEYDVVCGRYQYESESGSYQWQVIPSAYACTNDLFVHTESPVVFIPKEKISKSLNIKFEISYNDNIVAIARTMIVDLNDPTVSDSAPSNPQKGQLWLNTSASPSVLKMWDGSKWVDSSYQNGNVVYTSKPEDGYSQGDLWILSEDDGNEFEEYGVGAILKANAASGVFDITDWVDVDKEATEQKKNIKQYFLFDKDTGLRIGQSDDKFYVNISSTRMSFCENPLVDSSEEEEVIDSNEVVSISNRSATIRNLTVEEGATFNCEVQFGNFILKTESNGSLSLALAN